VEREVAGGVGGEVAGGVVDGALCRLVVSGASWPFPSPSRGDCDEGISLGGGVESTCVEERPAGTVSPAVVSSSCEAQAPVSSSDTSKAGAATCRADLRVTIITGSSALCGRRSLIPPTLITEVRRVLSGLVDGSE
jgi:hypothetical protein